MEVQDLGTYHLISLLAECCGGVAVVYSGMNILDGSKVAIKRYFIDKAKEKSSLIQHEIHTLKELQHQNILPYLNSFVHVRELCVVYPLMDLGSCRYILNQFFYAEGLPELACAIILKEVLQALQYLHKQLFIHRSVRASHVLLSSEGAVKLSGLHSAASLMAHDRRQKLHSLPPPNHDNSNLIWLSPELLEQNLKGYDERSDIYSVGILSCELANGAVPFSGVPSTLMLTEKVRGSRPQLLDCSTFSEACIQENQNKSLLEQSGDGVLPMSYCGKDFSEPFHHFVDLALQRDPEKRPSAAQLLTHAFFKQIRKTDFLPNVLHEARPVEHQQDIMLALLLEEKLTDMDVEETTEWDF